MAEFWEGLEREIRDLWSKAPLEPEMLRRDGAIVSWLGKGDPATALRVLNGVVDQFRDDKKMGALAAALGMHPKLSGNVAKRMNDYGMLVLSPPRDERTVRGYAEDAAKMVAIRFMQPVREVDSQPLVTVRAIEEDGAVVVNVRVARLSNESICVRASIGNGLAPLILDTYEDESVAAVFEPVTVETNLDVLVEWIGSYSPNFHVHMPDGFATSFGFVTSAMSVRLSRSQADEA